MQIIGLELEILVASESTNAASSVAVESETLTRVATTITEATGSAETTEKTAADAPIITTKYAESTISTAAPGEWTAMSGTACTSEIRRE